MIQCFTFYSTLSYFSVCPANMYGGGSSDTDCSECPQFSISLAGSLQITDCRCVPGYGGSDGGPCIREFKLIIIIIIVSLNRTQCDKSITIFEWFCQIKLHVDRVDSRWCSG